jgi:hypothetical protein
MSAAMNYPNKIGANFTDLNNNYNLAPNNQGFSVLKPRNPDQQQYEFQID